MGDRDFTDFKSGSLVIYLIGYKEYKKAYIYTRKAIK
jgi:hypothetical protein